MNGGQDIGLKRLLLLMIALSFISMLPNITTYEFRAEEARRFLVAFEMSKTGDYLLPTLHGETYFNKPPLFNWLVAAFAGIVGWKELTVRLPSLLSALATTLLICYVSYCLYRDRVHSLLSGLIFVTSLDILYWYGWLGEIDTTLTLFVSLMIFSQLWYFRTEKRPYLMAAGVLAGTGFLLKGVPAYVFFGISLLTIALSEHKFARLFSFPAFLCYLVSIFIPLLWLFRLPQPLEHVKVLFSESASRVETSRDVWRFLTHLVEYPLLTLKQTLPASLFVIFAIALGRVRLDGASKTLALLCLFNYLPYLFAAGSRGRYILPLFPLAAIVAARLILGNSFQKERFIKVFLIVTALSILGRFAFGIFWLPYDQERRGSSLRVAREITQAIDISKPTVCDCPEYRHVCVYLSLGADRIITTPLVTPDWEYLVRCSDAPGGEVLKTFGLRHSIVTVRKR